MFENSAPVTNTIADPALALNNDRFDRIAEIHEKLAQTIRAQQLAVESTKSLVSNYRTYAD